MKNAQPVSKGHTDTRAAGRVSKQGKEHADSQSEEDISHRQS